MNLRKRITAWMLPLIVSLALGVPVAASFVIPNASVTSAKLASGAAAANIGNGGVTQAMRVALGQQVSTSSGTATINGGSFADITNLTVTITTTGRPVFVGLMDDGSGSDSRIENAYSSGYVNEQQIDSLLEFKFIRDAATLAVASDEVAANASTGGWGGRKFPVSSLWHIDTGASAASHTYKIQGKSSSPQGGTSSGKVVNAVLIAYEL